MDFDNLDDFHVEKLEKKKKKKNGNRKGKRVEREIVHKLNERFKHLNESFSRSVGSGNRYGQVKNMPKHAKETLTGDLCCPQGFKFVIESKGGYSGIDLNSILDGGNSEVDKFLEQVTEDSTRANKMPMLIWKRDRKPWLCFLKTNQINGDYDYKITYRDWTCILLDSLLNLDDKFFFD